MRQNPLTWLVFRMASLRRLLLTAHTAHAPQAVAALGRIAVLTVLSIGVATVGAGAAGSSPPLSIKRVAPTPVAYPASYFSGPLGRRNLLPARPGVLLIDMWGGTGVTRNQFRSAIAAREGVMGRRFDGLHIHYGGEGTFRGLKKCVAPDRIRDRDLQWVHDTGHLALVSWSPDRSMADVNAGLVDACFRVVARHLKSFRFPVMLRLWWEFDGSWTPWSGTGRPFVRAWRRVVGIFSKAGATNVGFWWCPNERARTAAQSPAIDSSYPGDAYVDWVGADIYNWETVGGGGYSTPLHPGWAEFWELFDYVGQGADGTRYSSMHDAYGARKPFVIGETGTVYDPNATSTKKGDWFRDIPRAARSMEYLRGISFYDADVSAVEGERSNFRVDFPTSIPDVYDGFKQMAMDPWMNTNSWSIALRD
jgi:hypothetical protein